MKRLTYLGASWLLDRCGEYEITVNTEYPNENIGGWDTEYSIVFTVIVVIAVEVAVLLILRRWKRRKCSPDRDNQPRHR